MSPSLRLLQVVPYFEPAWAFGGPPRVMSSEAHELAGRGHDVTVFTTDAFERDKRLPRGSETLGTVDVNRFPNLSNRAAFDRYRFQPRGMRKALRDVSTDVVHLSETRHELAILTWRACASRDLPLLVSAHGTLPRRSGWKGTVRAQYDRAFVTPMIRGAAALIAQTDHEGEVYLAAGAKTDQVHLVPLGLDPPPADIGEVPDLGAPPEARVVLFLGRIHPLKGTLRLITGFKTVLDEHPDAWLVIAGRDDGGGRQDAEKLAVELGISHRVSFPGPIYGEQRFQAYRRASVFAITPTHYEETSLASLEAASVGTPLLVSRQAELPYLGEYGGGTMVGENEDPGEALSELLSGDLIDTGSRAAAMITERHSWRRVGDLVEQIMRSVT